MFSPHSPQCRTLDLEALESNSLPTFVIKIADRTPFEIIYGNEAFRKSSLQEAITSSTREALLFRSWTTAIGFFNPDQEFAGHQWTATLAGSKKNWKIVQAIQVLTPTSEHIESPEIKRAEAQEEMSIFRAAPRDDLLPNMSSHPHVPLGNLPSQNVQARWNSLQTMMEMSDVGVFEYLPNGKLIHANDAWYRLSNHPRNLPAHVEYSFMDLAYPDDRDSIMSAWNSLVQGDCVTFEMRWKAKPGSGDDAQWVLSACVPVFDEDQNLISIAGNTIDINGQKKLQEVQRRQIEEALEAKRQQENFIDMTSHELRNPLSAVVQCADSVISTLQDLKPTEVVSMSSQINEVYNELSTCIDNLQTIVSCSLHQKRIIDDVLTLSKLDSNLLLITPMRVQPSVVVSEALKMFDVECAQMQIDLRFREDQSLREFEWVMIDPSRMLQVLINLLTNAIKFTKDREVRNITVTLGGSWVRNSIGSQVVTYAKDAQPQFEICDKPEWGLGRKGYVWLRVDDTGCGMTDEEQAKLFSRFTQATPRTHIKYGGSGLGLFISKSLAALQGGSIGVHSIADRGSTFEFYISTRTADPPRDAATGEALRRPTIQRAMSGEAAMKVIGLNILMVEDNVVNQKVLSKQLQKVGCNVSVAGNGIEALEWLKSSVHWHGELPDTDNDTAAPQPKYEVDIILMDIEMPVMDGLACTREIRAWESRGLLSPPPTQPMIRRQVSSECVVPGTSIQEMSVSEQLQLQWTRRLPILAVSANARSEQVEQALAAGMDDAISKPFRIPELWPKMRSLVPRASHLG